VHPKQALGLFGDRTLFQSTVQRLAPLLPAERVLVVTVREQLEVLRAQVPEIPEANFIVEPAGKGTAAVVGLAAVLVEERHPGAVLACLPADHFIAEGDRFLGVLRAARALALQGGLVTLGIPPTCAATGYGYIQRGESLGEYEGHAGYRVASFKEKPSRDTAEGYVASGQYAWNSGMFVWRTTAILGEIERQMPALHGVLREISDAPVGAARQDTIARLWQSLKPVTVDYGIMEGARNVAVIPADGLGWIDVGTWERLFDVLTPDAQGNLVLGEGSLLVESNGCLVYRNDPQARDRLVALYGVRDMIVVDAGDVIMMCPRDRAEEIRRLVERVAAEGRRDLL
jgi:mannose-1-phosphate guanylyltransferase